jgi:NCS1 family nucleobase:cation symporter-1
MGGYAVFLAPITGTLVFDFFFVHQRKLKLTALVSWYLFGVS